DILGQSSPSPSLHLSANCGHLSIFSFCNDASSCIARGRDPSLGQLTITITRREPRFRTPSSGRYSRSFSSLRSKYVNLDRAATSFVVIFIIIVRISGIELVRISSNPVSTAGKRGIWVRFGQSSMYKRDRHRNWGHSSSCKLDPSLRGWFHHPFRFGQE
ncbi:hypothetical protein LINPERHAP2_LOCUS23974, partial [Linum perenne]